jgi:hypothetical protein
VKLFGKREPNYVVWMEHELQQGTQVPMIEVDETFIEEARRLPKTPRYGHLIRVGLFLEGDQIVVARNKKRVARMEPSFAVYYLKEMKWLHNKRLTGVTEACIKPKSSKASHSLLLNRSAGAMFDGGIL